MKNPLEHLRELTQQVIDGHEAVYLVDLETKGSTRNPTIWVLLDSDSGGVSIDICAKISRELSVLIDANELFDDKYRLNVASPGLDRPLTDRRQYASNKGRTARVRFENELQELETAEGTLADVSDEAFDIEIEGSKKSIPFTSVVETKIIPSF